MHGELPKQKLKTKPAGRSRRALTILVALVAVAAALGYVFFGM